MAQKILVGLPRAQKEVCEKKLHGVSAADDSKVGLDIGYSSASAAISFSGTNQSLKVLKWPPNNINLLPFNQEVDSAIWQDLKTRSILLASTEWDPEGLKDCVDPFKLQGLLPRHFANFGLRPELRCTKAVERFIADICSNIVKELKATYGDEASAAHVEIGATVPPYYTKLQRKRFKEIVDKESRQFQGKEVSVTLINRDEACMICFETEEGFENEGTSTVIACHMEEDITTLSFITAERLPFQQGLQTRFKRIPHCNKHHMIPIGSNRIGCYFELAGINRIFQDMDRVSLEGISGLDMSTQMKKAKQDFLRDMPNRDGDRAERVILRCNTSKGRRDVSYTLSPADVQKSVLDPVLGAIAAAINLKMGLVGISSHQKLILFSGILSECPYVFKYMEDYFENRAVILDVNDGSTAACRGAVLRYGKNSGIGPGSSLASVSVLGLTPSVQDHFRLNAGLNELEGRSHTRSHAELVPIYELAAFKLIELPAYRISLSAPSVLRVDAFLRKAGSHNCATELCKKFCAAYYNEEIHNPELDFITKPLLLDHFHETTRRRRNLVRHHVDRVDYALHLATLLGDYDVIRVALSTSVDTVNLLSECGHCCCIGLLHHCYRPVDAKTGVTALYLAIRRKNQLAVELLLNHSADPNIRPPADFTPLHAAAEWGNEKVVKMLIDRGAEIHAPYQLGDKDCGYTALHVAAERGHESIVCLLLDNGAHHSVTCQHPGHPKWPPIYFAVLRGHEHVVRLLLERSATLDPTLEGDRTLLSIAAEHGYEAVVQLLLKHGAKVNGFEETIKKTFCNAAETENRTQLQTLINAGALYQAYGLERPNIAVAAEEGLGDLIKILLANGEDIEQEHGYGICCHVTPLFLAAVNGHRDIAQLLLDHGANIQREACHYRFTPIRSAAKSGQLETVQMLLDLGADPYIGPYSALHDACFYGHLEVVKLLLDNGVDVNYRSPTDLAANMLDVNKWPSSDSDFLAKPPLYSAAAYQWSGSGGAPDTDPMPAIVRLLIDRGADVNTELSDGTTLLHEYLTFGTTRTRSGVNETPESLFYFLLDKGADVNAKDHFGRTPLHYIAKLGEVGQRDKDIASYIRHLVRKGADIYARDRNGKTPIDSAVGPAREELQRTVRESDPRTSRRLGNAFRHRAAK